jgi:hypothetical protein
MESESSSPHSQEPATYPYPEESIWFRGFFEYSVPLLII